MAHKHTYPVIDRSLRDFLAFLLMLLAVVTIATAIASVSGVDTGAIDAQIMGVPDHVLDKTPDQADEHIPAYTIQAIDYQVVEDPENDRFFVVL